MYSYEEFKEGLTVCMADMGYEVSFRNVTKTNGVEREALSMPPAFEKGIAPVVYMDDMYAYYQNHSEDAYPMVDICNHIVMAFENTKSIDVDEVLKKMNLRENKDKISFDLVNTERNMDKLSGIPHREFLDMSIVYRIPVSNNEMGEGSVQITNDLMNEYGFTEEDLFRMAKENGLENHTPKITSMIDTMMGYLSPMDVANENLLERERILSPEALYVLSNEESRNGAGMLVYDDVLEKWSDIIDQGFYIIPSSRHEVLLVPENSGLKDMSAIVDIVHEVNSTQVLPEDYLSDTVYFYDRNEKTLTMENKDSIRDRDRGDENLKNRSQNNTQ